MRAVAIISALATTCCFSAVADGGSPEQAVLEALLRHVVAEAQSQRSVKAFCVSGFDAQSVPIVRARVKAEIPSITDASGCPTQSPGSRETGYVSIWLGAAVRVTEQEFIARAEVYRNPLNAESRTFTLHLRDGRWVVIKSESNWVS